MNLLVQQGWQCPLCSRVYSPTTPMCFYCPPKVNLSPHTHISDDVTTGKINGDNYANGQGNNK